ncbi:unnamed protein product [Fructobacillus evanidus]|uniref:Uncharacterized protein n=1 Tax=Fructobacillus evanidus TaxID=3064281 RepID=A0ABN9YVF5_9LACO|nr:unnamed protein product [Fructobacillus sp. LMG 32999]CAK1241741.1 unnamed protein product [Fructobacillus sp. LMG 32999]CAK1248542.1 unnamed protein product [Fructobacillus sp. LMG 32999]CAK1248625.1 unnamed protein product [Fructobacillus sp. LMG 32999]CAK1250207.1 unnamed protein product [Fructobacillus sp. LMG 32999]
MNRQVVLHLMSAMILFVIVHFLFHNNTLVKDLLSAVIYFVITFFVDRYLNKHSYKRSHK